MSFVCSVCGEEHDGLPALALGKPDYWLSLTPGQQEQGKIDANLCATFDDHYFVRGVLVIPITDGPEPTIEFGPWSSLSADNFKRYVATFEDEDQSKLGEMFGWLSNELYGFPGSLNLKCHVLPQDSNQRPLIELEPTDHPLALAQRNGISFERALQLVHRTA
jgi:hypothetical protein